MKSLVGVLECWSVGGSGRCLRRFRRLGNLGHCRSPTTVAPTTTVWVVHNTTLETVGEEPGMDFNGNLLISHTDITIGVGGNPLISHMDIANSDLELYVCDDPACSSGTNVELETTGSVGWDPAVTISDNDNPVISHGRWDWDEADGDLELYVCDNPACSSGTNVTLVTTGSVGVFSSITTGDDGNPVIAHQEYAKGDLEFAQVVMPDSVVAYQ